MSATRPPAFDDRFSPPIEASRRGAHRARPKPASAGVPVAAGAAVILLVLGGGYVMLKGGGGVSDSNANLAAASAVDAEAKASASPGAAATSAAADSDEEPDATATKTAAKVDRDVRFKLLNSTSISGLAKRIKTGLEDDGWTIADEDTGNSINRNLSTTKIYYGKASTKATAQALKKDLGFGTIVKDASTLTASDLTTSDLVVVLGEDADS